MASRGPVSLWVHGLCEVVRGCRLAVASPEITTTSFGCARSVVCFHIVTHSSGVVVDWHIDCCLSGAPTIRTGGHRRVHRICMWSHWQVLYPYRRPPLWSMPVAFNALFDKRMSDPSRCVVPLPSNDYSRAGLTHCYADAPSTCRGVKRVKKHRR